MRRNIGTRLETAAGIAESLPFGSRARILDLGCGDGVFLEAAGEVLRRRYPERFPDAEALAQALTGVEIDATAGADASTRLTARFGHPSRGWDIRIADALSLAEEDKYEVVIGNPPWVRLQHMDASTRAEARSRFQTAKGPFNVCYLFVEKAIRLLAPGGRAALIVPRGINWQPGAAPVRDLLSATGPWTLERLPANCLVPTAAVAAGILRLVKDEGKWEPRPTAPSGPVLGDLAVVRTGVATGADSVFVVRPETAREWQLEEDRLRPVVRGRDIRPGRWHGPRSPMRLIWPYRRHGDRWILDDLSSAPGIRAYLEHHRAGLVERPRLAGSIERDPCSWYRFIDPQRPRDGCQRLRMALPDIFREPGYALIEEQHTTVLNTCFELLPRPGLQRAVTQTLEDWRFWERLRSTSRVLSEGFCRTSVTELRSTPLTGSPS